jgi:type II secretory pathway pseudopilin PulG
MKRNTPSPGNLLIAGSRWRMGSAVRACPAFSLIEIMVVVSLMTVIILGLMAMFGQTQKAFRGSMTQVDVLASGRATMDLLTRELEQIKPSYLFNVTNFYVTRTNVFPLVQPLPGTTESRTNVLEEFYFLTQENQQWSGIGYRVSTPDAGVGTLYRFYTNAPATNIANLSSYFKNSALANLNRIADGVVHLRVRAYTTNGYLVVGSTNANVTVRSDPTVKGEIQYSFLSNALPAYLELELGILEQRTLERVRSIPNAAAQRTFLENHAGQVHLFRQRIPVRNVDPTAYQ